MAKHNIVGTIGESEVAKYLVGNGYTIQDLNYLRRCGEIDIVAVKKGVVHFVEVKSVSLNATIRPEENLHGHKIQRLKRVIQIYLADKYKTQDVRWVFDLICVYLDDQNSPRDIKMIENLILA